MALPVNSRFNLKGNIATPMRYMKVPCEAVVNFDDATPNALFIVQDGDIVGRLWTEITTVFDAGTIQIGDGGDADGLALFNCGDANPDVDSSILGYKLIEDDSLGAYLWDAANSHRRCKIYTGADTIDAVRTGAPTQGALIVYCEILRLKE